MKHIETSYCHTVIVGWELYGQPSSLQNIWMNQISQDDFNTCICFRDLKFHAPSYTVDPMWQEKNVKLLDPKTRPGSGEQLDMIRESRQKRTLKKQFCSFWLWLVFLFWPISNKVHGSSKNSSLKIENMANRSSSWFSLLWTQMSSC